MSDITTAIQSILSDVSVDSNGVVSITRNGLCNLLGIRSDNLISERMSKKLAENLALIGFSISSVGWGEAIPDTAIAIIVEYYAYDAQKKSEVAKQLFRAFSSIGIRSYFQRAKGWSPEPMGPSGADPLTMLGAFVEAYQNLTAYTKDKPGLHSVVRHAITSGDKCLPGLMSLSQVLGERWEQLSQGQKCAIGRMVSDTYKSTYLEDAVEVWMPIVEKGVKKSRKFKVYPTDFNPQIESCYSKLIGQ